MISRSDCRNFHLLLADRPLAYPMERDKDPMPMTSVCFWYVYGPREVRRKARWCFLSAAPAPGKKYFGKLSL
jgi:hypothetical protein